MDGVSQTNKGNSKSQGYDARFVLALEKVDDDRVVAPFVVVPTDFRKVGELSLASAVPIGALDVGLLLDSIEILVQAVEKECNKFLRVVLLVAREGRRKARKRPLEV